MATLGNQLPACNHRPTWQRLCFCNLVLVLRLNCQQAQDEAGILADLRETAGQHSTAQHAACMGPHRYLDRPRRSGTTQLPCSAGSMLQVSRSARFRMHSSCRHALVLHCLVGKGVSGPHLAATTGSAVSAMLRSGTTASTAPACTIHSTSASAHTTNVSTQANRF